MRVKASGSALLSALFIMTLVAIAATAMSTRLQLDIYRTELTLNSDKLYLASQAVTFWAMDTLGKKKLPFSVGKKNGKLADFPHQLQKLYPAVSIRGQLYDLQAHFNLNNLSDKKYQGLFFRLLENSSAKMSESQCQLLINAILYWITPYQRGRGQDTYLNFYLNQKPPYLPAYQFMQSVSELRLVRGVSADIYDSLLSNITALPEITPININTASPAILRSLGNGLNPTQVQQLIHAREEEGIKIDKITELLQKLDIPREQITVESNYYLSVATISNQDLSLTVYAVIKRNVDKKEHLLVNLIRESINTI